MTNKLKQSNTKSQADPASCELKVWDKPSAYKLEISKTRGSKDLVGANEGQWFIWQVSPS